METLSSRSIVHESKDQATLVDLGIGGLGWLVFLPSARVPFKISMQHLLEEKPSEATSLGETPLVPRERLIELVEERCRCRLVELTDLTSVRLGCASKIWRVLHRVLCFRKAIALAIGRE